MTILHRDLDAFLERQSGSLQPQRDTDIEEETFTPAAEIVKDDDKWMVSMCIPGVNAKSIDIEVVGETLRVRGERPRDGSMKPYLSEIPYGRFEREFALTADIDADHVQAGYRDGVLELVLPAKESARPRGIAIATDTGREQLSAA